MGWMTAHRSKNEAKKNIVFVVGGRCLIVRQSLKTRPNDVQSAERLRAKDPRYKVGVKLGFCSFTAVRTTSETIFTPEAKTRSVPVAVETTPQNSRLFPQKGAP